MVRKFILVLNFQCTDVLEVKCCSIVNRFIIFTYQLTIYVKITLHYITD